MRMHPTLCSMLVAGGIVSAASPWAHAADIAASYSFSGSTFVGGTTPPFASIIENIALNFDNSTTITGSATGAFLISGTVVPTSTLEFSYIPAADLAIVGGSAATNGTSDPVSTDFAIVISHISSAPRISSLTYSTGSGTTFAALTTTITPIAVNVVPEPASMTGLRGRPDRARPSSVQAGPGFPRPAADDGAM